MIQSTGDPIADMHEDMAAEQKARLTYDNILRLIKDPEVCDPIRYLREREIVHYQRFGESLRLITDDLDHKYISAFKIPTFYKTIQGPGFCPSLASPFIYLIIYKIVCQNPG